MYCTCTLLYWHDWVVFSHWPSLSLSLSLFCSLFLFLCLFLFFSLSLSLPLSFSLSPVHLASDRGGKIREADIPLFAALASASGKSQEHVRQLAKLACPLLTRLVLHHNQIAEVQYSMSLLMDILFCVLRLLLSTCLEMRNFQS